MAGRYSDGPGNTAARADEILRAEIDKKRGPSKTPGSTVLRLCLISRFLGRRISFWASSQTPQTDILETTYMKEVITTWVHLVERRLEMSLCLRIVSQHCSDKRLLRSIAKPVFTDSLDWNIRNIYTQTY